jgi:hypothetical protein
MAQVSGTIDTYGRTMIKEDVEDIISNVTPTDTPFSNLIGKKTVKSTNPKWNMESLRAATTSNAYVEGDEFAYTEPDDATKVGNWTQIMRETVIVSGTVEASDQYGKRGGEMGHQTVKKGKELALDREKIMLSKQAAVAGNASTARKMGGFGAWLTTNARRGAGGADGGYNSGTGVVDAPTNGTDRAFTKTLLLDIQSDIFTSTSSGIPKWMFVPPAQKVTFSGFTGIAAMQSQADGTGRDGRQAAIIAAADTWIGDFGIFHTMVSRLMPADCVYFVNPDYVHRGVLRPMARVTPAVTSDAERKVLICEETLIVDNEAAHGVIDDLL